MKHNEAIDMILDGGEAYRRDTGYVIFFSECGLLLTNYSPDNDEIDTAEEAVLDKEDFTETDWIVEKDGVVYEDYVKSGDIVDFGICALCGKGHRPFYCKLDNDRAEEPTNDERDHALLLLSKRYGELEEFRRSIVNEDWLEKKMSCFLGRNFEYGEGKRAYFTLKEKCGNNDDDDKCPFCFPQEKPKEEPHEKVTVEDMLSIIEEYCDVGNGRRGGYSAGRIYPLLKEKLTYLVSLQEK